MRSSLADAPSRTDGGEGHRARQPRLAQGIVEYGLILSLSAVLAIVLLVVFGGTVSAVLRALGDAIDAAS